MAMGREVAVFSGLLIAGLWVAGTPAAADEIKLKGGAKFSGRVLERGAEELIVELPRAAVETVNNQPLPPPVGTGTPAPAFTAVDVQGATQAFGAPAGGPTLIAFWATWCPHCRSDVSFLKEAFETFRAKGLRLMAVSIDRDPEAAKRFVSDQHLDYTVIAAAAQAHAEEASLPDLYEVHGIPAYYLIDARGRITKTKSGSIVEGKTQAEWDEAIKGLLPKS